MEYVRVELSGTAQDALIQHNKFIGSLPDSGDCRVSIFRSIDIAVAEMSFEFGENRLNPRSFILYRQTPRSNTPSHTSQRSLQAK